MGFEVIYKKRFIVSFAKVLDYLENNWDTKTANNFYILVTEKINHLKLYPQTGSHSHKFKNLRTLSVTKHNRIYYKITNNRIIIINLYDTRKKNYKP